MWAILNFRPPTNDTYRLDSVRFATLGYCFWPGATIRILTSSREIPLPRAIQFSFLALILVIGLLVIVRLSEYQAYFAQQQASTYVVQLLAILLPYGIALLFVGRFSGSFWTRIFKLALIFGLASGLIESLTIAGENDVLAFHPPALLGMLSVFAIWGVAGCWATITLQSMKAGLFTSLTSAAVCMLLGVAAGIWLELLIVPTNPVTVASWQEFKRSAWTDPVAFQIANTLDSAFDHLLLAPLVATISGAMGSALGRVLRYSLW